MAANRANYLKLGLTFAAGVAVIVATVVYLGGVRGRTDLLVAETYYVKPVSGLSVGSSVNFRGVKVGEVRDITFVSAEYDGVQSAYEQAILVRMGLDTRKFHAAEAAGGAEGVLRKLIGLGLRATVSASGVTGLSRIELDIPETPVPETEKPAWKSAYPCIPPGVSLLDSVSDSAKRIIGQVDRMDFSRGWTNVLRITESSAAVMERLGNIPLDAISTNLVLATGAGAAALENLRGVDFRARVDDVSTNATVAIRAAAELIRNSDEMVKSADRLVRNADALLEEQRGALRRVLSNLESASLQVKLLANDLRAHPGRLLTSPDATPLPETANPK